MLDKSIRFYLHALRAGEVKYSPRLSLRRRENGRRETEPKEKPQVIQQRREPERTDLIEFPLYFSDKPAGKIIIPQNLDKDDFAIFEAMVGAVKAYAMRKRTPSE